MISEKLIFLKLTQFCENLSFYKRIKVKILAKIKKKTCFTLIFDISSDKLFEICYSAQIFFLLQKMGKICLFIIFLKPMTKVVNFHGFL